MNKFNFLNIGILLSLSLIFIAIFTSKFFLIITGANFILLFIIYNKYKYNENTIFTPPLFFFIFSIHFFVLAPILLDLLDYQMPFGKHKINHKDYLSLWSFLNFIGLGIALLISYLKISITFSNRHILVLKTKRFLLSWVIMCSITFLLQFFVFRYFGGLPGYIRVYASGNQAEVFKGFGILFMFSESFPLLFIIGIGFLMKKRIINKRLLVPFLFIYSILLIFFGGLRGSRSMFLFRLFIGAGILHYSGVKIKKKIILMGIILAFLFINLYRSYYKQKAFMTNSPIHLSSSFTKDILSFILITDLSRVDVQTLIINKLLDKNNTYSPSFGRTYMVAFNVYFPTALYKILFNQNKPPNKTFESTNLIRGPNEYQHGRMTSFVHGLLGEALLNFGIIGSILPFFLLGIILKLVNSFFCNFRTGDARLIIMPIISLWCLVFLQGDFDNFLFYFMNIAFLPILLIKLGSSKIIINV